MQSLSQVEGEVDLNFASFQLIHPKIDGKNCKNSFFPIIHYNGEGGKSHIHTSIFGMEHGNWSKVMFYICMCPAGRGRRGEGIDIFVLCS